MPAQLLGQKTPETETTQDAVADVSDLEYAAAFMVLVTKDGNYVFEPNINKPIVTDRPASGGEIKGALSTILMDIQSQETGMFAAQFTVDRIEQKAKAAFDQQQNAAILSKMGKV